MDLITEVASMLIGASLHAFNTPQTSKWREDAALVA